MSIEFPINSAWESPEGEIWYVYSSNSHAVCLVSTELLAKAYRVERMRIFFKRVSVLDGDLR